MLTKSTIALAIAATARTWNMTTVVRLLTEAGLQSIGPAAFI